MVQDITSLFLLTRSLLVGPGGVGGFFAFVLLLILAWTPHPSPLVSNYIFLPRELTQLIRYSYHSTTATLPITGMPTKAHEFLLQFLSSSASTIQLLEQALPIFTRRALLCAYFPKIERRFSHECEVKRTRKNPGFWTHVN